MSALVIDAHPSKDSLCKALAETYRDAVRERGASAELLCLRDLRFDPILQEGYRKGQPLEPDLEDAQRKILAAKHLTFVYPSWWGTYPALLKGFLDRTLLPGFAFRFRDGKRWDKLLQGRSGRLIVTMDWPGWAYWLLQGSPGHRAMAKATLGFCGVTPVRITELDQVRTSSSADRERFFAKVRRAAAADARALPRGADGRLY